ncbi:MAG: hypothetical protein R2912_06090 [Eubacteriales bacterium]
MVTHDPHIAGFGDKVIHLLDGRITQITQNGDKPTPSNEPQVPGTSEYPSTQKESVSPLIIALALARRRACRSPPRWRTTRSASYCLRM